MDAIVRLFLANSSTSATSHLPSQESIAALSAKIVALQSKSVFPASASPRLQALNQTLVLLSTLFSDAQPAHLRNLVRICAKNISESVDSNQLSLVCVEAILNSKCSYPKRIGTDPLQPHELFRDSSYAECAKLVLFNEFPQHSKHTITQILLECNDSYTHAYKQLLELPTPRMWSLVPSFLRPKNRGRVPVDRIHSDVRGEMEAIMWNQFVKDECAKDEEVARDLNRSEYTQLIQCPVCIDDVSLEECVSCSSGCLVCKSCFRRVVNVGIFETGDLRGKVVTCFLQSENEATKATGLCGASYREEDVRGSLADSVWRVYDRLILEKAVTDAYSREDVVTCKSCGYAEIRDPPPPESLQSYLAKRVLALINRFESMCPDFVNHPPPEPTILFAILIAFEIVVASFAISMTIGIAVFTIVRILMEVTGFGHRALEVVADVYGVDPNVLWSREWRRHESVPVQLIRRLYNDFKAHLQRWIPNAATGVPVFNCSRPECGVATCVGCGAAWEFGHTCYGEIKDSLRVYVEMAMSEAFIRTCPRCLTRFTKQGGCNKMTCPTCRHILCYVCRRPVGPEGYAHFCQHFRPIPGMACTECDRCDLYATGEDELMLRKVAERAEREWRNKNSSVAGMVPPNGLKAGNVLLGRRT